MTKLDSKKRDLLKTLPITPALLLGGAAGLTTTPAQGQSDNFKSKVIKIGRKFSTIWTVAEAACQMLPTIEEAFVEFSFPDALGNIISIFRGKETYDPTTDVTGDPYATQIEDALESIGVGKNDKVRLAKITAPSRSKDDKTNNIPMHLPVVRTNTTVAVFIT